MGAFTVFGLIALVVFLANRAPGLSPSNQSDLRQSPGPDTSIPAQGATDKFAPTLTGGSPLIAQDNRTRLGMTYTNAQPRRLKAIVSRPLPGSDPGILGNLTNASASGTFKLENPPPQTSQKASYLPKPAGKLQPFKF